MENAFAQSHIQDLIARNAKLASSQKSKIRSQLRIKKTRSTQFVRLTTITSLMLFATLMVKLKDLEASPQLKD
jgi:hypothetical protein